MWLTHKRGDCFTETARLDFAFKAESVSYMMSGDYGKKKKKESIVSTPIIL